MLMRRADNKNCFFRAATCPYQFQMKITAPGTPYDDMYGFVTNDRDHPVHFQAGALADGSDGSVFTLQTDGTVTNNLVQMQGESTDDGTSTAYATVYFDYDSNSSIEAPLLCSVDSSSVLSCSAANGRDTFYGCSGVRDPGNRYARGLALARTDGSDAAVLVDCVEVGVSTIRL